MWRWTAHTKFSVGRIQAVLSLVVLMVALQARLLIQDQERCPPIDSVWVGYCGPPLVMVSTGKIKEIIISSPNSDSNRQKIEGYLAHKLGLAGSLPSSHPYSLGAPMASSGSPSFITDTPFGSGKAIDLADGHVEVSTGESEDEFDGGAAFSVSAWVRVGLQNPMPLCLQRCYIPKAPPM